MDILKFHSDLINNYKTYIQSFLNIKDEKIASFVAEEIERKKLWPEPLVQFNPTFENAEPLNQLITRWNLHPDLAKIFGSRPLYRHQQDAIQLGAEGKEFVVTSGTGSGKSLTYIATIFNHILKQRAKLEGKVTAVIVYPMNALINSQNEEIKKYEIAYLEQFGKVDKEGKSNDDIIKELKELTGKAFPITYAQYTGQENDSIRKQILEEKPHILLTNYMMLELIMTRGGDDLELRSNILESIKFLVFDELHTYRGRQGSDVSMLIRRVKSAAQNKIITIGTSATMVSADHTTLIEQREEVAKVASKIFASSFDPTQIISEYLTSSLKEKDVTQKDLYYCIYSGVNSSGKSEDFEEYPTAIWLERNVALEEKDGKLVRRKPLTFSQIAERLANVSNVEITITAKHLEQLLQWANKLNSSPEKKRNYLPFRLHQFIAQTGSVYATLGDSSSRELRLEAGLYFDKERSLYPILFSRESGHEFYCVTKNEHQNKLSPREPFDQPPSEDDQNHLNDGYLIMQSPKDEELLWDYERDKDLLPDFWFNPKKKSGDRTLKSEYLRRIPQLIYFNSQGNYSETEQMEYKGWFISKPLLLDPSSGTLYTHKNDWTKLSKLGGEGRSTATTILSFETIKQLTIAGEEKQKQKLLSFTDNLCIPLMLTR